MKHVCTPLAILLTFTALSFKPENASAQTSVLQDKGGETSISLTNQSLTINAGDASIKANINKNIIDEYNFIGATIEVKADEGVATLLDGYKFRPDFSGSLYYQKEFDNKDGFYKSAYISALFGSSYFNLLKSDNSNSFDKKSFQTIRVKGGYNQLSALGGSPMIFGLSIDLGNRNNLDDLTIAQIYQNQIVGQTVKLSDKKSAYEGNYEKFFAIKLDGDAYIYPKIGKSVGRFAIGGYLRSQIFGKLTRSNAGVGVALTQDEAPTKVVAGLYYQFTDIFNQIPNNEGLIRRSGINIIVGYNIK